MSKRYEVGSDPDIEIMAPGDDDGSLWQDDTPAAGEVALVIGNPWACAYAVVDTLAGLEAWLNKALDVVRAAHTPTHRHVGAGERS